MYIIKTKTNRIPFYFPLTIAYSWNMPYTPPHSHDCTEIGIVLKGSTVHECNGTLQELTPGDVIIIPAYQAHSFNDTKKLDIFNVLFDPNELNMPVQDLEKIPGFRDLFPEKTADQGKPDFVSFHLDDTEFAYIRKLIPLMRAEKKEIGRTGYRSAILGLFMSLLCHLLRSCSGQYSESSASGSTQKIDIAIRYLNDNYLDRFDLAKILKFVAMSKSSFMTHFKNATGYSPNQYVLRKKIIYAIGKITKNKMSFSEIAQECGFHDSSHFCKAFRSVTGESPRAFRKRISKGNDEEFFWDERDSENTFSTEGAQ